MSIYLRSPLSHVFKSLSRTNFKKTVNNKYNFKEEQIMPESKDIPMSAELIEKTQLQRLENQDKKEDAQRYMAWYSLAGMLSYPLVVVTASFFGLDKAATILGDMAPVYFVSVAAILAAFYGKEAYIKGK
jgi:hypothetical protein